MYRHITRSNVIFRKFHHCSAAIKVNLIKTYCAPYCSQLWVNHTKCSYNKLRVAYNNAYRRVLGYVKSDSASNMFVNNQVDNFDAHNRHLIYSLRSRILNCNNSIVVCLNDCFYIRGSGPRGRSHCTPCEMTMTCWRHIELCFTFSFVVIIN